MMMKINKCRRRWNGLERRMKNFFILRNKIRERKSERRMHMARTRMPRFCPSSSHKGVFFRLFENLHEPVNDGLPLKINEDARYLIGLDMERERGTVGRMSR